MKQYPILFLLSLATMAGRAAAEDPVQIRAQSTKPMMDICTQLSDLFHWRITYEDAPVLNMNELRQETAPSGAPWLRMRAEPLSFAIPPKGEESMQHYRRKVMDLAIAAYAASGNRAAFTYTEDNEYIHVMPSGAAGPDGAFLPMESILNHRVTIRAGKYSLIDLVSSIVAQVGDQAGTSISLGALPTSLFASATLMEEADNEPAKAVLMRAFAEINGPRYAAGVPPVRLYWLLTYVADGPMYFFSAHVEPEELDDATIAAISRTGVRPQENGRPDAPPTRAGFVKIPQ